MKHLLCTIILIITCTQVEAQFLNRLKSRVENEIIDKVAEKVAEKIWEKTYKPMDDALEEAAREAYRDSTGTSVIDEEGYNNFLNGFAAAGDKLPASYTFDITNHYDVTDEDGKSYQMEMLYSKSGKRFGMINKAEKELQTIVYDLDQNIMALYNTDKKNRKSVSVMPIMTGMFKAATKDIEEDKPTFTKTGKSKTICGYLCDEYEVKSKDYNTMAYISKDFPITWDESMGGIIRTFAPALENDLKELGSSMCLESTSTRIGKKKTSHMIVTKVDLNPMTIDNQAYEKVSYGQ